MCVIKVNFFRLSCLASMNLQRQIELETVNYYSFEERISDIEINVFLRTCASKKEDRRTHLLKINTLLKKFRDIPLLES